MDKKIGVISCSGEECFGGTVARLATRKMMEVLKPDETVTICLPLFLAGGEEERSFAKEYPTIAVDGCDKCCAKRGTQVHSGEVNANIIVSQVIGEELALSEVVSLRDLTDEHYKAIDKLAEVINEEFEKING
ncbi:putative zinc-binding protein [Terrisporobacter vanillatitrophus]|uniref:putative zinc-binding protein n=1 Tax=Terrisporobacter vanillatitrophus TaxID=3058402 RepID=UPI003366ABB3